MIWKSLKKQLGQTSVEYALVIFVSVGLGYTMFNKLSTYLLSSNGFIGGNIQYYKAILETDPRYKRYRLPR